MAQKKGIAKGVAGSVAGGAIAGAGIYLGGKQALKTHETKEILLNDDNVNSNILLKAMKSKWKAQIEASPADANLDSEKGAANLIEYLYNQSDPTLTQLIDQKRLLTKLNMGDISFADLVKQQGLEHYVTQTVTPEFRSSAAFKMGSAIYSKYDVSLTETNFSVDSARIAKGIYEGHLTPEQIENLINSSDLLNAWRGNYNPNTDFDYLLTARFSSEEIAAMPAAEKCEHAMEALSGNVTLSQHGGFTGQSVADYINTLSGTDEQNIETLSTAIDFYRKYVYAKNYKSGEHYNLDFQDAVDLLGDTTEIQSQVTPYIDMQRDILETAIEHKCGLPEGTLGLDASNVLAENSVSPDMQEEFSRNIFNCESYIKYLREPLEDNLSGTQQIEAMGLREQIDAMIANGEIVGTEDIVQPISDSASLKLGGLGSAAVFGILLARCLIKSHKIKKQCAANPEAAAAFNEYMTNKQAEKINKKLEKQQAKADKKQAKIDKKNAKRNKIKDVCEETEDNTSIKKK